MKLCSKCGVKKEDNEFHRCSSNPDGLQRWCKTCRHQNQGNLDKRRARSRRYYYQNKDKQLGWSQAWAARNPERVRDRRLKRCYGLDNGAYNDMWKSQASGCAICGEGHGSRRLHVDHCHKTKRVRGLLCNECNTGLGKFKESETLLDRAKAYLEGEAQERE